MHDPIAILREVELAKRDYETGTSGAQPTRVYISLHQEQILAAHFNAEHQKLASALGWPPMNITSVDTLYGMRVHVGLYQPCDRVAVGDDGRIIPTLNSVLGQAAGQQIAKSRLS